MAISAAFLLAQLPYFTDFSSEADELEWEFYGGAGIVEVSAPDAEFSIELPGADPQSTIARNLTLNPGEDSLYIDFFLLPAIEGTEETAVLIEAGEAELLFVEIAGKARILKWEKSFWWDTGFSMPFNEAGSGAADWLRITLYRDWANGIEKIYVNNKQVLSVSASIENPPETVTFSVRGGVSSATYFGDFYAGLENPMPEPETRNEPMDPETLRALLESERNDSGGPDFDFEEVEKKAAERLAEARKRMESGEVRSSSKNISLQVFTPLERRK